MLLSIMCWIELHSKNSMQATKIWANTLAKYLLENIKKSQKG